MREEKNVAFGDDVTISGTLTIPESRDKHLPAILIVSGSGPTDRDGNAPQLKGNIYKELADFLESIGFVTLRYDKRGVGESEGDFATAGMSDLVTDAVSAVAFLREHSRVDPNRIVVLGHSEGGLLASAINMGTEINGIVMLAGGAGETLLEATDYQREIAYDQLESLSGLKGFLIRKLKIVNKDKKKAKRLFEKMRTTTKDTIRYNFVKLNAKWWREHMQFQLPEALNQMTCPLLAVTGSKDVQSNPKALDKLEQYVSTDVETHVIENMNHMLKIQHEDIEIQRLMSIYKKGINEPMAKQLQEVLETWLTKHFRR
ncbi:alpha/beta hydrolase [Desertibacillus haloalkaliphilus]|uniref:alpha/beta hydrolase n=1 Tax=Desertibacillus haloalkaliphilus TaxID=1328930 RepID=UPI001C25B230|nr:alpha/beta hydrolase [Desertibacillus haloalkaliphilus]MBU8907574.1 lysophospholipase [Desertibacillus haloalkaliphilus]